MSTLHKSSLCAAVAALAFAAGLGSPVASADDTEVFFTPVSNADKPNILFIVDSSATMGQKVGETLRWSPAEDWIAKADDLDGVSFSCDRKKLYWTAGSLPIVTNANGKKTVDCSNMPYIQFDIQSFDDPSKNKFVCKTALDLLRSNSTVGYVTQGLIAQYDKTGNNQGNYQWKRMQGLNNNGSITLGNTQPTWITECLADDGVHGINMDSMLVASTLGRRPNNATIDGFGNDASSGNNSVYTKAKGAFEGSFTFYTADRIGYEVVKANSIPIISDTTRLKAVQEALRTMIESVTGVRVGLMRFDNNAGASKGGMVVQEMVDIEAGKVELIDTIFTRTVCNKNDGTDCQKIFEPADKKSIGEALWEAYRYYSGGPVDFGKATNLRPTIPFTSVPDSMVNPTSSQPVYKSPITECGKNYIVLLTDGLTEQDNSVDVNGIASLPNFRFTPEVKDYGSSNAKCDVEDIKAGPTSSDCVDDLPAWMFRNDVNTAITGTQNVKTFTIGFDLGNTQLDLAARAVLRDAARRGGGEYYDATDQDTLEDIFDDIVRQILLDNASFTAPSVAVNAFNRTQNLNDLFMSVFKPSLSYRWLGNVKKYRLTPQGEIIDNSSPPKPAVDVSTGFFAVGTKSYWSDLIDGPDASLGGAAGELTNPAGRNVYTNIAVTAGTPAVFESGDLTTALSTLKGSDTAIVDFANKILYDADTAAEVPGDAPSNSALIDWAYGIDVQDKVGTAGTTTDARLDMGDPLHARPATVIYGGPADDPDTVIFATTNDGMLHAINAKTGAEYWAFAPVELLPRMFDLYKDDGIATRVYGLDGSVRAYKIDNDQDGVVDTGGTDPDRVLLFFGMRRGGSHYYALDVTNKTSPKLLWRVGAADDTSRGLGAITTTSSTYLPGIGQSWSSPIVTRMNIDRTWSSANPKRLVAVFGGGYDPSHDSKTSYADDVVGNRIYIVDAITGDLIWRAGPTSDSGAQLKLDRMMSAIPGDIRSFDLTGDGFDDRMYASDLGGRIWRFDITNGATPTNLVKGGVFASLGVGDLGTKPDASNRKFFYAPDPSLIRYGGRSWINVAVGSGDRERPVTDKTVQNRFYSIRDYNIFTAVPTNKYLDDCSSETGPCHQIITSTDTRLSDLTTDLNPTLPTNTVGWYMNLVESGEKALAESRTFQNSVYFTTYTPRQRNQTLECGLAVGVSKLFVVNAVNAQPIFNYDVGTTGATSASDRSKDLAQGAIAPEVVFIFPTPDNQIQGQTPPAVPPVCLVGLESCGAGLANPPVRTYWRQRGAN